MYINDYESYQNGNYQYLSIQKGRIYHFSLNKLFMAFGTLGNLSFSLVSKIYLRIKII